MRKLTEILSIALVSQLVAFPAAAESLRDKVARIESAVLEPARAVSVQGLSLTVGRAAITLERGTLIPASATADGHAVEVVFNGEGRIVLEPPDGIEASQLELFTGKPSLDEEFNEAVLVAADDAVAAALRGGPPVQVTAELAAQAAAKYEYWKSGPYRRVLRIGPSLLGDHVGEPPSRMFFAAMFSGGAVGDFVYAVDGDAIEEMTLGQFLPEELTGREKRRASRELAREQRRGRGIGLRIGDLGMWNTWVSASLDPGSKAGRTAAFEPDHYALDVTIEERSLTLKANCKVGLTAVTGGRRVLSLTLHPDLHVHSVTDANGLELFHHRWHDEIVVVLPSTPPASSRVELNLAYSGVAIEKGGRRTYAVRDPEHWYPQTGLRDRATYEATFRWPRKLNLLAAGHRVDGGVASDGRNWARYTLDFPTGELGFEIGTFEIEQFQVDHVAVTLGFDASGTGLDDTIRKEIRTAVSESLRYLEEKLGRYPLDELTVVTVPRSHSQSLLGFITLSTDMMRDYAMWAALLRAPDRRAIIAHELAHQWWGHVVGWNDYRAQWFSEAMAQYASMRFTRERLSFSNRMKVVPTAGWQHVLTAMTPDGRTVESVGPLVLGERLSSSRAPGGYSTIIYDKGSLVVLMLGRVIGEQRFDRALRSIVERGAGKLLSTEQYLDMLGEASGLDVEGFARQWIYGTGVPAIRYTYDFVQPTPGRWKVKGVARKTGDARFHYRLVSDEMGKLDVARERAPEPAASHIPIFIPVRIEVLNPADKRSKRQQADEGSGYVFKSIVVRGRDTRFEIDVPWEPKKLELDPDREVLAQFRDERRNRRRTLYEAGAELAADRKWLEAERTFRDALGADPTSDLEIEIGVEIEGSLRGEVAKLEREILEAQLHLGLARVLLETHRDREASRSLTDARKALGRSRRVLFETEIATLEARLDMRAGDAERAFHRLRKVVLGKDSVPTAEGYLLLAIAARDSGHRREFEKARDLARRLGIDVSALR